MGKGLIAIGIIAILAIAGVGIYALWNTMQTGGTNGAPMTAQIKISDTDYYAGSLDAATTMLDIYELQGGTYIKQETVTLSAAMTATGLTYTTGDHLYVKQYDSSDTSLCTRYFELVVPYATWAEQNAGYFQLNINSFDRGNTAYDILVKCHNDTSISANAVLDASNSGWDSANALIDLQVRNPNSNTGYRNSFNFLRDYDNNHYIVITASGTGYNHINLLTKSTPFGSVVMKDIASVRYMVVQLSGGPAAGQTSPIDYWTQSDGTIDPDGVMLLPLQFDLSGITGSDNVTLTYMYKYYASWNNYQNFGSWGADAANNPASEVIYITP